VLSKRINDGKKKANASEEKKRGGASPVISGEPDREGGKNSLIAWLARGGEERSERAKYDKLASGMDKTPRWRGGGGKARRYGLSKLGKRAGSKNNSNRVK